MTAESDDRSQQFSDAVESRLQSLPRPVRPLAATLLRLRTRAYQLRYGSRLEVEPGAIILARLRLTQGSRLSLGARTRVRGSVIISGGGVVEIGADTLLNGCWIVATERVTIGPRCLVSDCGITDSDYHHLDPVRRHEPADASTRRPVRIGTNVWVGAHALVLKGTQIGDDSVIGAGAVVRGDIPSAVLVTGNPGMVVRDLG